MFLANKKIYLMVLNRLIGLKEKDLLSIIPELDIIANVEPIFIFTKPSADITPDVWLKLANEINNRFDEAAGFVILHGIDNLLYTSAALSFLLQNLTKPIIFTGSQNLPDTKKPETRANLINAVSAATCGLNEIALMFGNRLLRANQSVCAIEKSLNIFSAPPSATLGRIDFSIRIFEKSILKNKGKIKLFKNLYTNIGIIEAGSISWLNPTQLFKDKKGIIINAGTYQNLPSGFMTWIKKVSSTTPVLVWTKQVNTKIFDSESILLINNMTWETTVAKFMWALAQNKQIKKIKKLMITNIAGEIMK